MVISCTNLLYYKEYFKAKGNEAQIETLLPTAFLSCLVRNTEDIIGRALKNAVVTASLTAVRLVISLESIRETKRKI